MAEPVGINGTAAGLVSLGLQLYNDISRYIDVVKGRQQDLNFIRRQCENFRRCIDAIEAAMLTPRFRSLVSSDALDPSTQSCQSELSALNELVFRLQGSSSPSLTMSEKLRERERQLAFPFHRENLIELEKRLESTTTVLQLAMQAFGLCVVQIPH
ncbi:unnamed protein product [Colletotrichum noveboracense]|uniref:Fungal N-terminal domain-containing protein n=1 Tax=Colletotrichum noveboracense TaxID=2664923 RepID=A0A9W4W9G8_9PEZI|nr:unnamed protein product [Colletotrichum noveboracense]